MEESSEQKYDRIQREIQSAILKNYPNPERIGCRGKAVVEPFAKNPDRITASAGSFPLGMALARNPLAQGFASC